VQLATERLLLREFAEEDWARVLAYQSDPRYLRFYEWETRTSDDARAFVGMFLGWQHEQPRRRWQLAVTLRDSGLLIGNCGIRQAHADVRCAELGYELDPAYWGQGYATEAARAMLAFAFGELGMHRVQAEVIAENTASARVLEKLGFRIEGRLRENQWFKGRRWDTLLYGLVEDEERAFR